ncbi:MAG: hypothetical protein ACTHJR_01370 [Sphingomonas sp.]|uniref:hypothetical protein n=1 Tax=Sphingomonas sp. TaxID=28214 RepID=UPI003F81D37E
MKQPAALAIASFLLGACAVQSGPQQAERVASEHLAKSIGWKSDRNYTVRDQGKFWLVDYDKGKDWAGGRTRVWVRKDDMKVADVRIEQ